MDSLIQKWTRVCQEALQQLHEKAKESSSHQEAPEGVTIGHLFSHFQIEEDIRKLLRYNAEMDGFD